MSQPRVFTIEGYNINGIVSAFAERLYHFYKLFIMLLCETPMKKGDDKH